MAKKKAAAAPASAGRVASRGKREPYLTTWKGRLPQPDALLQRYAQGRDGMNRTGLLSRMLQQFPNIAGWCQQWVDHVLEIELSIQPAKSESDQATADAAAIRMKAAWERMGTSHIAMQNILMARFYGFARAEIVPTFDTVLGEWVPWLYDVPQEAWLFDDAGREFIVSSLASAGEEIDQSRFLRFTWGSADTKYGAGILSKCYVASWKIQQLEQLLMTAIEDNNAPCAAIGIPSSITDSAIIDDIKGQARDSFGNVIFYPTDEPNVKINRETAIAASGQTGRPETGAIEMYERWIQTNIFGAPQTGNRMQGTGKVEETRKDVWGDGTTAASNALGRCLTDGWARVYSEWNLADLDPALWPVVNSTSSSVAAGLTGVAAETFRTSQQDLAANRLTREGAIELWVSLGISQTRAAAVADAIITQRAGLTIAPPAASQQPPTPDPAAQEAA